jgi:branched-chain amino acid transport system substrate-binding protein
MGLLAATVFLCSGLAAAAEKVNIGVIYPLSGAAGFVGQDALRGIELAVDQANSQGGVTVDGQKYELEVRSYDDEATPAKSVQGLRRLKSMYDIPVVIMMFSGPTLAVIENNEDLGVLWTGMSMHPDITEQGNELVMRHNCTISDVGKVVGREILNMGFTTTAHLCSTDDWGRGWDEAVTEVIESKEGAEVLAHEFLDERSDVDMRAQLTKIKGLDPDALFIAAHDEVAAMITQQARELGLEMPLVHSEGFQQRGWEIVGPENLDGCYYVNVGGKPLIREDYPDDWPFSDKNLAYMKKHPNKARKAYVEAFKEKFPKKTIAAYGFASYENTWALKKAMEEAQSVDDPYAIREAMYEVMPLSEKKTTMGVVGYTENGNGIMNPVLMEYKDGIWRIVKD